MADWVVKVERHFDKELKDLEQEVREELLAHAVVLESRGPALGRPLVDTLRGSAYANMKELRFSTSQGVWRVAFAFDPESRAVLIVAGDKAGLWGKDEDSFYDDLIHVADVRFKASLQRVKSARDKEAAEAKASRGKQMAPRTRR